MNLSYCDLTSPQLAQAASIFRDELFGSSCQEYLYEVEAATGLLTGQRSHLKECGPKKAAKITPPMRITSSGTLTLSTQAARFFAQALLPSLTVSASMVHADAG